MTRSVLALRRWVLAAALSFVLMLTTVPASAQNEAPLRCSGEDATIVGTEADDRIEGTAGNDVIMALGGNDVVFGRGGDDLICGGAGRDRLVGGAGRDVLLGEAGRDKLRGGPGTDLIAGGSASDRSFGGPGGDVLFDGSGNDLLLGGKGADLLDGGRGRDRCSGDSGYDAVGAGCEVGRSEAAVRTLDIAGLTIRYVGESPTISNGVTVTIWGLIAELDEGATFCLGPAAGSPSCSGPIIDGLDVDASWASDVFGRQMGIRSVEVTWPPVDGRVQLRSERSAGLTSFRVLPGLIPDVTERTERPTDCVDLDWTTAVGLEELQAWGLDNPEEYGGTFTAAAGPTPANRGIPAMQVKATGERLEAIRSELTSVGTSPCLISVSFTATELATARDQFTALRIPGLLGHGTGRDAVQADVVAIDRKTIDEIVAAVDRPDLVELTIQAILR